ncbi:MAG TPA: sensor histidine kinase N-terminal domain-containing protein [Methylococcus sp.]|nr:sensor histidine kinase N-terminal domain-containing protein [Methylococcus sp.]
MDETRSLRAQIVSRLILRLALLVLLDGAVSYFIALHYAHVAYDRWLLDSALSLAQEIKGRQGRATFELSPTALELFRWDEVDQTYFKIESRRAGFLAGDKAVPTPPLADAVLGKPHYFDGEIQGKRVRAVAMWMATPDISEEVLVEVAETTRKRQAMTQDILLAVILPQLLLILVAGFHIWTGVNRGLQPLHVLTRELAQRSATDLVPIPDSRVPLELRTLTRTINELLERLSAAMKTQRRFIENAAHQLRTPLAGLKIQAERALRIDDLAAMQPALVQIRNCADRVAHLNNQLLAAARSGAILEANRQFASLDLGELARDVCIDWVPKALERGIDLSFDGPQAPVQVTGDGVLLRELLHNLLDNAIRYGRSNGRISVGLGAEPAPCLTVEDDGPGIPDGERDRVFERFYRIPGSPGDGCGLGLAIVKEIADLHRARILLERPNPSGGTRIAITLEGATGNHSGSV